MDLEDVLTWFNNEGLPFQWRTEPNVHGRQALLKPTNGQSIALGEVDVAIVIPDVHLGFGNDVFQALGPSMPGHSARLQRFLNALLKLRDMEGSNNFCVAQVGDWYDFYRAPGPTVDLQVAQIETQYQGICNTARAVPVLHCIGNHDAALYKTPHATTSRFGIAQPIGSNAVMAYHGHDNKTLQKVEDRDLGATVALNIFNLFALVPILGQVIDLAQMAADDSFNEGWSNQSGDKPWSAAPPGTGPAGWDAPWVARDGAAELVRAARGLEYITDTALEVVFVGHSHRPGISFARVTAERTIPIVDVGSWTYGRGEIAIITPEGIGLAALPVL